MSLAATIADLDVSRYVIFGMIVLIYGIMGCFMDALAMVMMTVPIFLPIVTNLGFDRVWFGVVIVMVMMMGVITPPVGMNCYVISGVAKDVPLQTIFKGSVPFVVALLVAIIIVTAAPQIALFLPNLIYH